MSGTIDMMLEGVTWIPAPIQNDVDGIPYATHSGVWHFQGRAIRVYRLSNGKAVIHADDLWQILDAEHFTSGETVMDWKEWLMDITHGDNPPCFVPYEREDDTIVFGMTLITDRCPGELVGIIHAEGQEAVEKYCTENPNWHERFKSPAAKQKE